LYGLAQQTIALPSPYDQQVDNTDSNGRQTNQSTTAALGKHGIIANLSESAFAPQAKALHGRHWEQNSKGKTAEFAKGIFLK
jgi:hypothetical protein